MTFLRRGALAGGAALVGHSLRQLLAAGFAVPFLERLVGDLALDEELSELAPLRLTLERQCLTLLVTPVAQRHNASCIRRRVRLHTCKEKSARTPICTRPSGMAKRMSTRGRHIRYAVVGLGYIAQVAVLPAFAHARRNSRLAAPGERRFRPSSGDCSALPARSAPIPTTIRRLPQAKSTRSTSRCPTPCTPSSRSARPAPACTCCARSRWRSPLTNASG